MASSPDFVTHALDLLALVGPVQARAMFGGHGLYARGVMFGLLDDDELFLKTDEACRPRFAEAGCRQWVYVGRTQRMENTSYFRPPDDAHEDPEAMLPWARLALDAALRVFAAKEAKAAGKQRRGRGTPAAKAGAKPARRATARREPAAKATPKAASRAAPRRGAEGKGRSKRPRGGTRAR
jgi:DNA transformation protein